MTDNEDLFLEDIAEIRRRLNNEYHEESEMRKMRIAEIMRDVKNKLKTKIPVRITEQMRYYGIVDQVNELLMRHEVSLRLAALSRDEDDDEEDDAIDFT
jgi:hypothetical protein